MKRLLAVVVVGMMLLVLPGSVLAQDVLEWPGHMFFRPLNPTLRFNGGLIMRNKTNAYEMFQFGSATGVTPHLETNSQSTGGSPNLQLCGTSPSIDANSNDMVGIVTQGTGSGGTNCVVVFAVPYTLAPICMAINTSAGTAIRAYYRSATSVEFGGLAASDKWQYLCVGLF